MNQSPAVKEGEVFGILYKWRIAAADAGKTEAERDVRKVIAYFERVRKQGGKYE